MHKSLNDVLHHFDWLFRGIVFVAGQSNSPTVLCTLVMLTVPICSHAVLGFIRVIILHISLAI